MSETYFRRPEISLDERKVSKELADNIALNRILGRDDEVKVSETTIQDITKEERPIYLRLWDSFRERITRVKNGIGILKKLTYAKLILAENDADIREQQTDDSIVLPIFNESTGGEHINIDNIDCLYNVAYVVDPVDKWEETKTYEEEKRSIKDILEEMKKIAPIEYGLSFLWLLIRLVLAVAAHAIVGGLCHWFKTKLHLYIIGIDVGHIIGVAIANSLLYPLERFLIGLFGFRCWNGSGEPPCDPNATKLSELFVYIKCCTDKPIDIDAMMNNVCVQKYVKKETRRTICPGFVDPPCASKTLAELKAKESAAMEACIYDQKVSREILMEISGATKDQTAKNMLEVIASQEKAVKGLELTIGQMKSLFEEDKWIGNFIKSLTEGKESTISEVYKYEDKIADMMFDLATKYDFRYLVIPYFEVYTKMAEYLGQETFGDEFINYIDNARIFFRLGLSDEDKTTLYDMKIQEIEEDLMEEDSEENEFLGSDQTDDVNFYLQVAAMEEEDLSTQFPGLKKPFYKQCGLSVNRVSDVELKFKEFNSWAIDMDKVVQMGTYKRISKDDYAKLDDNISKYVAYLKSKSDTDYKVYPKYIIGNDSASISRIVSLFVDKFYNKVVCRKDEYVEDDEFVNSVIDTTSVRQDMIRNDPKANESIKISQEKYNISRKKAIKDAKNKYRVIPDIKDDDYKKIALARFANSFLFYLLRRGYVGSKAINGIHKKEYTFEADKNPNRIENAGRALKSVAREVEKTLGSVETIVQLFMETYIYPYRDVACCIIYAILALSEIVRMGIQQFANIGKMVSEQFIDIGEEITNLIYNTPDQDRFADKAKEDVNNFFDQIAVNDADYAVEGVEVYDVNNNLLFKVKDYKELAKKLKISEITANTAIGNGTYTSPTGQIYNIKAKEYGGEVAKYLNDLEDNIKATIINFENYFSPESANKTLADIFGFIESIIAILKVIVASRNSDLVRLSSFSLPLGNIVSSMMKGISKIVTKFLEFALEPFKLPIKIGIESPAFKILKDNCAFAQGIPDLMLCFSAELEADFAKQIEGLLKAKNIDLWADFAIKREDLLVLSFLATFLEKLMLAIKKIGHCFNKENLINEMKGEAIKGEIQTIKDLRKETQFGQVDLFDLQHFFDETSGTTRENLDNFRLGMEEGLIYNPLGPIMDYHRLNGYERIPIIMGYLIKEDDKTFDEIIELVNKGQLDDAIARLPKDLRERIDGIDDDLSSIVFELLNNVGGNYGNN